MDRPLAGAALASEPPKSIPAPPDVAAPPDNAETSDSGLAWIVLQEGTGDNRPKEWDVVTVNYTGWTTDGRMFDSSTKRGKPAEFPLNRVIKGWTEGVQLMPVGSKYRVVIPSELAYGEQGAPPVIEPNSVLVFEIELLGIEADAAQ